MKTLEDKVNAFDFELIKAFIRREAQDYSRLRDNSDEWVNKRIELISEKLPEKGDRLRFTSLGNTGVVIRNLTVGFQGEYYDYKAGNTEVTFCICGKDSCWGNFL